MLKGRPAAAKTRFVSMAHQLNRPLITVALSRRFISTDLVETISARGDETVWHDGPLKPKAVETICYLDEVVEARKTGHSPADRPSAATAD